ncbi:MAG: glycine cleavage system protein GcvH [Chloroflexi bacterium]|nr:glycine cleavage system protein GcvH [Chloroflexota bacterium]
MSDQPLTFKADRKYTATHEWAKQEGDLIVVGLSDYAQNQLGDIVFVEFPARDKNIEAGKGFGVIESVKAASDIFAPVSGQVVALNEDLGSDPALINKDPYGAGWVIKVRPSNPAEFTNLIDAATYEQKVESGELGPH